MLSALNCGCRFDNSVVNEQRLLVSTLRDHTPQTHLFWRSYDYQRVHEIQLTRHTGPKPHASRQTTAMEARERRPQPKPELELPIEIDKEKLKKRFDVSHFDINAILRGAELTLVGGV